MAVDPLDPVIQDLTNRITALETFRGNARDRIVALETEVDDLRHTARAKLVEHLKDHIDAGYDFREFNEHKGVT
jgi:hypothetical protein